MNYYMVCPTCGHKLLKAGEGSNIKILCPKCGEKMSIEIKDNTIILQRVLSNKSEPT